MWGNIVLTTLIVAGLKLALLSVECSVVRPGQVKVSTGHTCAYYYTIYSDDTCENIQSAFHVTKSDLLKWNKGLNCKNLTLGQVLCVKSKVPVSLVANGTKLIAGIVSPTLTTNAPSTAISCSNFYKILTDDTCDLIAAAFRTNISSLIRLNPGLDCAHIVSNEVICVPVLNSTLVGSILNCTSFYTIFQGDTCENIATAHRITQLLLSQLNPGLNCDSLPVGHQVCVDSTTTEGSLTTTSTESSSSSSSSGGHKIHNPASGCENSYTIYPGDTCENIANAFKITNSELETYNGQLNCEHLPIGEIIYVPCAPVTSTEAYSEACKFYYDVTTMDTCESIAGSFQITLDFLHFLNPHLDCEYLMAGDKLCLPDEGGDVAVHTTPSYPMLMMENNDYQQTNEPVDESYSTTEPVQGETTYYPTVDYTEYGPTDHSSKYPIMMQAGYQEMHYPPSDYFGYYPPSNQPYGDNGPTPHPPYFMQTTDYPPNNQQQQQYQQIDAIYYPTLSPPVYSPNNYPPMYVSQTQNQNYPSNNDYNYHEYYAPSTQSPPVDYGQSNDYGGQSQNQQQTIVEYPAQYEPAATTSVPYTPQVESTTVPITNYPVYDTTTTAPLQTSTTYPPVQPIQYQPQAQPTQYPPYQTTTSSSQYYPSAQSTAYPPVQSNEYPSYQTTTQYTYVQPTFYTPPAQQYYTTQYTPVQSTQYPQYYTTQYPPVQPTQSPQYYSTQYPPVQPTQSPQYYSTQYPQYYTTEYTPVQPIQYQPVESNQYPSYEATTQYTPNDHYQVPTETHSYVNNDYNNYGYSTEAPIYTTSSYEYTSQYETTPTMEVNSKPPSCQYLYTISQEDTCESIASSFKTTLEILHILNPDIECYALPIGQRICIPEVNYNSDSSTPSYAMSVTPTPSCKSYYTVCRGDTCDSISAAYHITTALLFFLNPGLDCHYLVIGQRVCIPSVSYFMYPVSKCENYYTIYEGDSCEYIASGFRITIAALLQLNPGLNCDALPVQTKICVPASDSYPNTPKCEQYHTVAPGDTCNIIADKSGITLKELHVLNPGINCYQLEVGRKVCVPGAYAAIPYYPVSSNQAPYVDCSCHYKITEGDSCDIIARVYKTTVAELHNLNPDLNCEYLDYGRTICVYGVAPYVKSRLNVKTKNVLIAKSTGTSQSLITGSSTSTRTTTTTTAVTTSRTKITNGGIIPSTSTKKKCQTTYKFKKGDTCFSMSLKLKIELKKIKAKYDCNKLKEGDNICL